MPMTWTDVKSEPAKLFKSMAIFFLWAMKGKAKASGTVTGYLLLRLKLKL